MLFLSIYDTADQQSCNERKGWIRERDLRCSLVNNWRQIAFIG